MHLTYTELLSYCRRWSKMTSITDRQIYIVCVWYQNRILWIGTENTSMNCYARRDMNFVLYKECLNPCRLKRLQFTFHLFHKFSTQDKGSPVFISKGNNLPTIAQCKFKTFLLYIYIITLGVTILEFIIMRVIVRIPHLHRYVLIINSFLYFTILNLK